MWFSEETDMEKNRSEREVLVRGRYGRWLHTLADHLSSTAFFRNRFPNAVNCEMNVYRAAFQLTFVKNKNGP
jgi:hypothetical protein